MKLKRWHRRAILAGISMSFITASVVITLLVFRDNVVFFFSPTEFLARPEYHNQLVRIGGVVQKGSIKHLESQDCINFIVTDFERSITVKYSGPIPTLFTEGSGTVVLGQMKGHIFIARELLAKHDENYMPKEVADILKSTGNW
jgi:cytochrome c-type biogenesis protein CcmE